MNHILFLITLCLSIFTFNHANENQMPESLKQYILNGEVQKVIEHLNQNPNDINLKTTIDNFEHTALMLAIKSDSLPMFNVVFSKTKNVNQVNKLGTTALMFLSRTKISEENQSIFAELLLQNGALINAQNISKNTALIIAIVCENFKLASFLIAQDANINIVGENNVTAFFNISITINYAANENIKKNAIDIAKLLIQKRTDLNHINNQGLTPLMVAIYYLNIDLIIFLLKNGAQIDFMAKQPNQENCYDTALIYAIDLRNHDINKKNALYNIIQLLIDKKSTLSYQYINHRLFKKSPLVHAIRKYDLEIVKLLVESESDIQEKDPHDKNAIDYAREYYEKEDDPKIKQKRKKIIMYLENPYQYLANEDRAIFASTFFSCDKQANVPKDVTNIIIDYIHEPEKIDDIDQIKKYLRNSDVDNIKSILTILPTIVISKDEMGYTPLILMVKYYYYDKYINKVDELLLSKELSIIASILQNLAKLSSKENNYLAKQLKSTKYLTEELKLHVLIPVFKQYEKLSLKI